MDERWLLLMWMNGRWWWIDNGMNGCMRDIWLDDGERRID